MIHLHFFERSFPPSLRRVRVSINGVPAADIEKGRITTPLNETVTYPSGIMIWYNGSFYTFISSEMSLSELVKVAESMIPPS